MHKKTGSHCFSVGTGPLTVSAQPVQAFRIRICLFLFPFFSIDLLRFFKACQQSLEACREDVL